MRVASFIHAGYSVKKFTSLGRFFNYGLVAQGLDQAPKKGTQRISSKETELKSKLTPKFAFSCSYSQMHEWFAQMMESFASNSTDLTWAAKFPISPILTDRVFLKGWPFRQKGDDGFESESGHPVLLISSFLLLWCSDFGTFATLWSFVTNRFRLSIPSC
jgi:hypothetical protein